MLVDALDYGFRVSLTSSVQTTLERLPEASIPDFPLTKDGITDMSYYLQALDDSLGLDSLPDLDAMCRAVSVSDSPLIINPAIRGYHSFGEIRAGLIEADDDVIFWDLPCNGERGRCGPKLALDGTHRVGGCVLGGRSHYGYLERYHCGRSQCPDWHCLRSWAMDKASAGADRLAAADYLMNDTRERIMHLTLSWSPDSDFSWMYSREAFNKKMREVYRFLMSVGISGGCLVFHPYRWVGEDSSDGIKRMPADALIHGLTWVFGPHVHVVGFGWVDGEAVRELYERFGIVIKVISYENAQGGRLRSDDAVSILGYCLSHSGVGMPVNGRGKALKSLRDFGSLSGRSSFGIVRVASLSESENMGCPVCDGSLVRSPLYDLFSYSSCSVPLRNTSHFGVYCPKVSAPRVREDLEGLSPLDMVQYSRDNPDVCFTRCTNPDDPAGLRRLLTRGELAKLLSPDEFRRSVWGDSGGSRDV